MLPTPTQKGGVVNWLRGIAGGVAGGAAGSALFALLLPYGFYAMPIPGVLLGMGCGLLSGIHSKSLGLASGVAACALGIFTEWRFFPFAADTSWGFFVAHLSDLNPVTQITIAVGGLFGFWFGRGREGGVRPRRGPETRSIPSP